MEGKYAWQDLFGDSSASKFEKSLSEGQEFIVRQRYRRHGASISRRLSPRFSLAFAPANTAADKQAAAQLIEFLLNSDEGAKLDEQPARHPALSKEG